MIFIILATDTAPHPFNPLYVCLRHHSLLTTVVLLVTDTAPTPINYSFVCVIYLLKTFILIACFDQVDPVIERISVGFIIGPVSAAWHVMINVDILID